MERVDKYADVITESRTELGKTNVATFGPYTVYRKYDYLSAGNYLPGFRPGTYRMNPVTISKCTMGIRPSTVRANYLYSGSPAVCTQSGPLGALVLGMTSTGFSTLGAPTKTTNSQLEALALVDAYAKMNESAFDGGVFLGELAETIHMLRSPLKSAVKLLTSKRWKDPEKVMKASTDTWMEFRYGIRPVINDVANIAALFTAKSNGINRKFMASRSGQSEVINWRYDGSMNVGSFTHKYKTSGTRTIRYHIGLTYSRKLNYSNTLHQYGIAVQDMPNVLWELTPLSFVADWFYGVGNWLRAITPNPAVNFIGGHLSRRIEDVANVNFPSSTFSTYAVKANGGASAHLQQLIRTYAPAVPALPVRKVSTLGLARSIDSAILLLQRIPKNWR